MNHLALNRAQLKSASLYIGCVVFVNVGFSLSPYLDWFWSFWAGAVLVFRDLTQRSWGHWTLALMLIAGLLSVGLGAHQFALASTTAFLVSETVDWMIYVRTRKPFAERVFFSTAISGPLDTTIFLSMAGFLSLRLYLISIGAKILAAAILSRSFHKQRISVALAKD